MLDRTKGPARTPVDGDELRRLEPTGTVIVDDRRRRPLYFDGRFLAARDLTREQNYFLSRQADIARASGGGVVDGLVVTPGETATTIVVTAGHGVTGAGEALVLPAARVIDLANLADSQRLDRAFGVSQIPRAPSRGRTGLFVVALRPVEFTANPIASYPTSLDGKRSVEDGDIIEGLVVTLIPLPDNGTRAELETRRGHIAREIFHEGSERAKVRDVLPIGVVALDRGIVRWVDPFLVRREVGAERRDILGIGVASRSLREAFLLQYDHHLRDVLQTRDAANQGRRFAASEHFLVLPPAGRLPTASIDANDFTQLYFPPEVEVELSIVPEDEVPAVLEESFTLPPVDLTLSGDELQSTSVMVLAPVTRARLDTLSGTLTSFVRTLSSSAPGLVARRRALDALRLSRLRIPLPVPDTEAIADGAWREILAATEMLWYVRRRNYQRNLEIVGVSASATTGELEGEAAVDAQLRDLRLRASFTRIESRASAEGFGEAVSLLRSPSFLEGPAVVTRAAISELEALETVDRPAVLSVRERFADPGFGEGIARLEAIDPGIAESRLVESIARTGRLPELDRLARVLTEGEVESFSEELAARLHEDPEQAGALITERLAEVERVRVASTPGGVLSAPIRGPAQPPLTAVRSGSIPAPTDLTGGNR